jgi:hypothetical protein
MSQTTIEELENRVRALEATVATQVANRRPAPAKELQSTIGMFDDDPVMAEIQEEERKVREARREAARNDPNYDFG